MKLRYLSVLAGGFCLLLAGCTEKYPIDSGHTGPVLSQGGCVACHTDQELLKQVADPLPPPSNGDSGEG